MMWQEIRPHNGTLTELAHLTQISFLEEVCFFSLTLAFVFFLQVHQLDHNVNICICIAVYFSPKHMQLSHCTIISKGISLTCKCCTVLECCRVWMSTGLRICMFWGMLPDLYCFLSSGWHWVVYQNIASQQVWLTHMRVCGSSQTACTMFFSRYYSTIVHIQLYS